MTKGTRTDQRRRSHVSTVDRRQGPDIHEALGLQRAGFLVGAYGDPMSRSKVFGGFTLAQWLTTRTGESPTSSARVSRPEQ